MFVAGIDAHATYSVIAIVSNTGQLVAGPIRIKNTQEDRLDDLLQQYQPLEVLLTEKTATSERWGWPPLLKTRVLHGRPALVANRSTKAATAGYDRQWTRSPRDRKGLPCMSTNRQVQ